MIRRSLAPALTILLAVSTLGCDAGDPADAAPTDLESPAPRSAGAPPIRVRVATAEVVPLRGTILVPGVVRPFQKATVAAKIPGRVQERLAEPGDRISSGAALLRLDETDLLLAVEEAQIALRAAGVDRADAEREVERARRLRSGKTISTSEMDARQAAFDRATAAEARAGIALKKAEQALADATVRAPFDGSVEAVDADVGEYLQPGAPVATMVDFSRARIRAGVTATEASQLASGQNAAITFDTLGGTEIEASVRSVARVPDPGSGTYAIELWLDEPDARLREGMIGQVHLERSPGEPHPVVPRAAIVRRAGRTKVFVLDETREEPRVVERGVESGRNDGEYVEILAGTQAGDRVVIDGHFALADGAVVIVDQDEE